MPARGSALTPAMVSGGKRAPGETERRRYIYQEICRRHNGGGEGNGYQHRIESGTGRTKEGW